MKTLLFIGVLIAVISWSSALKCWGKMDGKIPKVCRFDGKTLDKKACEEVECGALGKSCGRSTAEMDGRVHTTLSCTTLPAADCVTADSKGVGGKFQNTLCYCDKDLCNGADGTSYTHLIIAVIVGAMFFH